MVAAPTYKTRLERLAGLLRASLAVNPLTGEDGKPGQVLDQIERNWKTDLLQIGFSSPDEFMKTYFTGPGRTGLLNHIEMALALSEFLDRGSPYLRFILTREQDQDIQAVHLTCYLSKWTAYQWREALKGTGLAAAALRKLGLDGSSDYLPFFLPPIELSTGTIDVDILAKLDRDFYHLLPSGAWAFWTQADLDAKKSPSVSAALTKKLDAFFSNYLTHVGYLEALFRPATSFTIFGAKGSFRYQFSLSSASARKVFRLTSVFTYGSPAQVGQAWKEEKGDLLSSCLFSLLQADRLDLFKEVILPQVGDTPEPLHQFFGGPAAYRLSRVIGSSGFYLYAAAILRHFGKETGLIILTVPYPSTRSKEDNKSLGILASLISAAPYNRKTYTAQFPLIYQLVQAGDTPTLSLLAGHGYQPSSVSPVLKMIHQLQFGDLIDLFTSKKFHG
jgi:hypothetical protein